MLLVASLNQRNMNPVRSSFGRAAAVIVSAFAMAACASAEEVQLKWQSSDANQKLGGYSPLFFCGMIKRFFRGGMGPPAELIQGACRSLAEMRMRVS